MYCEEPYVHKVVRKATSATTFTARTPPIKAGDILIIDRITAEIDSHKTKYVDVGFIVGSRVHFLETITISLNDTTFYLQGPVYVPSDYRIYFQIVSPTDGVIYTFNIFGRIRHFS
jgi:hypothetical protein